MDEQELQEFDLEDIMREFGSSDTDADISVEEIVEETAEVVPEEPIQEAPAEEITEEPEEVMDSPTIRIPKLSPEITAEKTEELEQTVRLDTTAVLRCTPKSAAKTPEEDSVEEPSPEAEEAPVPVQEEPVQTEAFSQDWEPEYEQPIAEYIPPQPIIFHPRSRLRELKKKLVEGPEHEYYALLEKGVGKLQIAIFLSLLVGLISAAATGLYAIGLVQENRMRLMVFGQFLAMLISALLGSFQLIEGVSDLFKKKFTLNSYMVFAFIACCADGVLCLQQLRLPCCAAFSLLVTMSLWRTYQERVSRLGRLDTMRRAIHLDRICLEENEETGEAILLREEGQVEDFTSTDGDAVKQENTLNIYSLAALGISLIAGVVAGILHKDVSFGVQVLSVTLLAGLPATAFIAITRPMAVLIRKLHKVGTVLCGWQGVEGLCKKAQFPLTDTDIYPTGSVKMNGVKFFGDRDPDEVVAYANAVISANGGGLKPLFTQLLDSRNGIHYDARMLQGYDGGIGGEVNGESVLLGNAPFLRTMGVEVPEGIRVSQGVYVAIDGEFSGLFALSYEKIGASAAGLSILTSYKGTEPVLATSDFMLTESFIQKQFKVKTKRMAFPEYLRRKELAELQPGEDAKALALVTGDGLAPFAYAVAGARSVKTASTLGVVVHMLGGIVGIVMMLILAVLGAKELLTPGNMFLYELVWMIPAFMITEWTRHL